VPVHFLDLASAVEKLRWAEKEWRELDKELAGDAGGTRARAEAAETDESDEVADEESETVLQAAEPA
jgi:hypothetical protein